MRRGITLTFGLSLLAGTARSQAPASSGAVATLRELWKTQSSYVLQSAEAVPESLYSFRPASSVRTFGQLIGHVAGSQYHMCAIVLGEPDRPEDAVEQSVTTKAALVEAMRASTAYCERAYALSDEAARNTADIFGMTRSRLFILGLNATHDGEHYGNLITYMRINGIVPPSSRPRP